MGCSEYIPSIDFSVLKNLQIEDDSFDVSCLPVVKELHSALSSVGFFYLVNHGIPNDIVRSAMTTSKHFFDLSIPIKMQYRKSSVETGSEGLLSGYTFPGQELLSREFSKELRETFDYTVSDDAVNKFEGREIEALLSALRMLEEEGKVLSKKLCRCLAIALELPDKYFFIKKAKFLNDKKVPTLSALRTLHYPQLCQGSDQQSTRCSEHTDYGLFTLLFQDMSGGLEVKTSNKWIHVTPRTDAILINTGDLLEIWTSGLYRATPHRVLLPKDQKSNVSRQSIVFFIMPDDEIDVHPMKLNFSDQNLSPLYKPVNTRNYVMNRVEYSYS